MSFRCQKCKVAFPNDLSTQYSPVKTVTKFYAATEFTGRQVAEEKELCEHCARMFAEPEAVNLPSLQLGEIAHRYIDRQQRADHPMELGNRQRSNQVRA